jgi:hypothetical protein
MSNVCRKGWPRTAFTKHMEVYQSSGATVIEKNEMGEACGAYEGGVRCAQGVSGET